MTAALWNSLKVLAIDVPLLALLGTALGWLLARKDFPGKKAFSLFLMLPIALPPSVVGLYLLTFLGSIPGMRELGFLFSFGAAALGSLVPALPLAVESARVGFAAVPKELEDAARTLGDGEWRLFFRITLPLARRTLLAGLALASARALGDFGVTLMIAGNIPGRTQTLPLFIYSRTEAMDFSTAHIAAALLAFVGIASLLFVRRLEDSRHERSA